MNKRGVESNLFETLSTLTDMILINVLFLCLSLPLFSYGAAKTAMYELMLKIVDKKGVSVREFLERFGQNFRKGLAPGFVFTLWHISATVSTLLCTNGMLSNMGFSAVGEKAAFVCAIISLILCNAIKEKYFLFAARFEGNMRQHFSNAVRFCLGYSLRSLLSAAFASIPVLCLLFNPTWLFRSVFLVLLLFFATVALFEANLMKKPISKLILQFEENALNNQNLI